MKGLFREMYIGLRESIRDIDEFNRGPATSRKPLPRLTLAKVKSQHSGTKKGRTRIGGGLCDKQRTTYFVKL